MDYQNNHYIRGTLPSKTYSRVEQYLRELCLLEDAPLPIPQSRIELLLEAIFTGDISKCETPKSREEKLIWALLTGDESDIEKCASRIEVLWYCLVKGLNAEESLGTEVNGKVIEECMSRIEAYLWYLIENGGSSLMGVEYELYDFVTTYNTMNTNLLKAVSSGETMVNIVEYEEENNTFNVPALESKEYTVQNDGTEFTLNNVEYSHGITEKTFEGGSETLTVIPNGYSTDGYKSAILKGNTLVNLAPTTTELSSLTWNANDETGVVKFTYQLFKQPPKAGKKYTFKFVNAPSHFTQWYLNGLGMPWSNNNTCITIASDYVGTGVGNFFLKSTQGFTADELKNIQLVIVEGDYTNIDIPYFEGMQSVRMPVLKTTGKNILNENICEWEQGSIGGINGELTNANNRIRTKEFIPIQNAKFVTQTLGKMALRFYDVNKNFIYSVTFNGFIKSGDVFSVPSNAYYLKTVAAKNSDELIVPNDITSMKSMIEYNTVMSDYEPHKTNILTVNEDVTLRSNGDIYDELNLLTGQLTQRIDENNEVLVQEVVKTVDLSIVNQDGETLDKLEYFNNGHIFIESESISPSMTYEANINGFKGTVNVGTVTNNVLTSTDKDIVIVEGNKTDCYIPKFKGMISCTDMCLEIENEDGSSVLKQYPINNDVVLRKVGDVEDTLNYLTGEYIIRIGINESNELYVLDEPIITNVEMNLTREEVLSFDGITKFKVISDENSLLPSKTIVTVRTSNKTDSESLTNGISLLSDEQNNTSKTISNTSEDIENVSNGLNEINNLLK